MREESVESHLFRAVKAARGLCVKLNPMGVVGIPDRLVLLPGGRVAFVECKKPKNGRIARLQFWWRDKLVDMGFMHRFVLTKQDVNELMETLDA
jgi:hypothetical protein